MDPGVKGDFMACELHEDMRASVERLRNDIAELYSKTADHEARLRELTERDKHREEAMETLRTAMERNQARLEGLFSTLTDRIAALAADISDLRNAPAKKIAARWDDVLNRVLQWAALGFVAWIASRGGKL